MAADDRLARPAGFADLLRSSSRHGGGAQQAAPEADPHEPEGQAGRRPGDPLNEEQSGGPDPQGERTLGRCRLAPRPQLMLGLRWTGGRALALPYSYLTRVEADDPVVKIALTFGRERVSVAGEHLLLLYHRLLEHRVRELVESDRAELLEAEDGEPVVTGIAVTDDWK